MKLKFEGDDRPAPSWKHFREVGWNFTRRLCGFGRWDRSGQPMAHLPSFRASLRMTGRHLFSAIRLPGPAFGFTVGDGLEPRVKPDTLDRLRSELDAIGRDGRFRESAGSLGGLYARELARAVPGTCDRGGRDARIALLRRSAPEQHLAALRKDCRTRSMNRQSRGSSKLPFLHLALRSRRDGIMAPRTARGLDHERDKAVETDCAARRSDFAAPQMQLSSRSRSSSGNRSAVKPLRR